VPARCRLSELTCGRGFDHWSYRAAVSVEVDELPAQQLPERVELAAYFVVSEALTNVAKHAPAARASVTITKSNGAASGSRSATTTSAAPTSISARACAVSPTAWSRSRANSRSTHNLSAERPCARASHARSPPRSVSTGVTPSASRRRATRSCTSAARAWRRWTARAVRKRSGLRS
jgi:hypothetical protein